MNQMSSKDKEQDYFFTGLLQLYLAYSCHTTMYIRLSLVNFFVPAIPAEFTQQLQSMEVKEGEDVTLSCQFSLPGVAFHWRRGLETLRAGERYLMKQKKSFISLTITGPKPQDSGDYTCQCRDHRTTASLKVHGKSRPCFSFPFPGCIIWSNISANKNQMNSITLQCCIITPTN